MATAPVHPLTRVVALIDMDCFYCACERALDPSLVGVPLAVIQYNPWQGDGSVGDAGVRSLPAEPAAARVAVKDGKTLMPSAVNGSIIAVSYEARARGVTRFFRGKEAVAKCPEIVLVQVPTAHGKSDMGIYRQYGAKVLKIISETCGEGAMTEKASVDEVYIDITVPARRALASAACAAEIIDAAAAGGTHVAGDAEAADEAERGAQPGGVLARNSFRAGHSGQVVRQIDEASARWWARTPTEWDDDEALLAAGAVVVSRARREVTRQLSFTCSAGVAPNKLLAKLCGGLHKPDQQTLLAPRAVSSLLDPLPVDRLRGFGGKLGELLREGKPDAGTPGFDTAGAIRRAGAPAVARVLRGEWAHPDEKAEEAWRLACGLDDAPVAERPLAKQVGSSKNFSGRRGNARGPIDTRAMLETWVAELAQDVATRLAQEAEQNGRTPTNLVASLRFEDDDGNKWAAARSKRSALRDTSAAGVTSTGMQLLMRLTDGRPKDRMAVTLVSLTADGFESLAADRGALLRMFAAAPPATASSRAQPPVAAADEGAVQSTAPVVGEANAMAAALAAAEAADAAEAVAAAEAADAAEALAAAQAADAAEAAAAAAEAPATAQASAAAAVEEALPVASDSSLRFRYPGFPLAPLPLSPARQADLSAVLQAVLGIAFASGKWTRGVAFASLIVLMHTLLLEVSLYQNHYWLLCNVLVCFVVADHRPDILQALLRFVHSLPYAFGAVAKLSADWLVRQQPVTRWCADIRAPWLSKHFLASPWCPTVLSVGGLVIDAAMVPLLCLPARYRVVAHILALSFHVANATLFHIGIFPFVMLSSHVLWMDLSRQPITRHPLAPQLANDAPARRAGMGLSTARRRRPIQSQTAEEEPTAKATATGKSPGHRGLYAWCIMFVLFHLTWPLRRWVLYNTVSLWSHEGYLGAWQMKQMQLDGLALLVFSNGAADALELLTGQDNTGMEYPIILAPQLDPELTPHQRAFVAARPHMLLQYAQHRTALLRTPGSGQQSHMTARAVSCFSLNNRSPQPLYRADRGLPPVSEYEWLGVSGIGVWLHPLRDPQTTSGPSAECTALLRRPQALLRRLRAGFHELRKAATLDKSELANETEARDQEVTQSVVYWHHVGALRSLVDG